MGSLCGRNRMVGAVTILAAVVNLALSCTPATCPPGPIIVEFPLPNCTGDPSYTPYNDQPNDWFVCKNTFHGRNSFLARYNDQFVEYSTFFGAYDCPPDWGNIDAFRVYMGVCTNQGASFSSMVIANINQTYVAPQIPDENPTDAPSYQDKEISCVDQTSCSQMNPYFTRQFDNDTCPADSSAYTVKPNVTINTCYSHISYTRTTYTSLRCIGRHALEKVLYTDSHCTKPFFSDVIVRKCGDEQFSTIYCNYVDPSPPSIIPDSPIESPVYSPIESPVYSPIESPVVSPVYSPTQPTTPTSHATQRLALTFLATMLISVSHLLV